ncbi:MAG: hypothetical protein LBG43_04435 [Treponema sp.]|jgi:hypothetical protein|nr:hypothetical protein [Treponema sp.]
MTHTKHLVWGTVLLLICALTLGGCLSSGSGYGDYSGYGAASGNLAENNASGGAGQGDNGSYRTASFDPDALAAARTVIPYTTNSSLADELQWLAVQTACLSIYNMAQTGDFSLPLRLLPARGHPGLPDLPERGGNPEHHDLRNLL